MVARVAMVVTATNCTLYLNGVKAVKTIAHAAAPFTTVSRIGSDAMGGRLFKGQIDEVRVWNTSRTSAELMQNKYFISNTTSPQLVGYWNFDAGNANDLTGHGLNGTIFNMGVTFIPETIPLPQNSALCLAEKATATLPTPFTVVPTAFTIEWWMNPITTTDYNQRIECNSGGNWGSFTFQTTSKGEVYVGTDMATRFICEFHASIIEF